MSRPPKGRPHTYDRDGVCVCGIRKEWAPKMPCASPGKSVKGDVSPRARDQKRIVLSPKAAQRKYEARICGPEAREAARVKVWGA